jgi:hypothetical protein
MHASLAEPSSRNSVYQARIGGQIIRIEVNVATHEVDLRQ